LYHICRDNSDAHGRRLPWYHCKTVNRLFICYMRDAMLLFQIGNQ